MPDLTGAINNIRKISFGFVDSRGKTRSVSLEIGNNIFAGGELASMSAAMGDASNAGIYRETERFERSTSISDATAVDESESSVHTVLVFQLQNNSAEKISFPMPAPDVSILDANRESLIVGDAGAVAGTPDKIAADLRAAVLAAVNNSYTPANSYSIVRTYVTNYQGRGSSASKEIPNVVEGGAAGAPPDAPAT